VIVQDAYHPTETTRFADILLPAAQWPEKEGVMTNSERRLTYLPKLVDPPGEALPDAVIVTRFAHEMGWKDTFAFESAAEIFDEFAALTAGTPCDCSGVSHERLRREGPLQGPVPSADHPGTARLYADGRFPTPDGRARFVPSSTRSGGGAQTLSAHPHHGRCATTGTPSRARRKRPRSSRARRSPMSRCTRGMPAARECATATSWRSPRAAARRWRRRA
jgi:predicted molibdopterin-dependent oxidoreductase YjgC